MLTRPDARSERGATLIELLVSLVVGGLVLTALLQVFVTTLRSDARTEDRVDSVSRARLAVDRATQVLGAQVCFNGAPPVLPGSTARVVTFYSDLQVPSTTTTPTANGARLERLTYDPTARTITDERWPGTTATGTSTRRTIGQDVLPPAGQDGPFRYFQYDDLSGTGTPLPDAEQVPGASGLTAAQVALTIRVRVDLIARTTRTRSADTRSTSLGGDAFVGTLDPLQPDRGARCTT